MLNPHSDIAFNWQESLLTVESRFFDHQIGVMLGLNVHYTYRIIPEINQFSDYVDPTPKYGAETVKEYRDMTDELYFKAITNIVYWSRIRENDRLFREGKSGYSLGDGILRKWGDG